MLHSFSCVPLLHDAVTATRIPLGAGRNHVSKSKTGVLIDARFALANGWWASLQRRLSCALFPIGRFELFLDLSLDGFKVEARRCLHWRKLDGRFGEFSDRLLHHDEAPELAPIAVIHVASA